MKPITHFVKLKVLYYIWSDFIGPVDNFVRDNSALYFVSNTRKFEDATTNDIVTSVKINFYIVIATKWPNQLSKKSHFPTISH